jgi:hypothetical protein
MIIGTHRQYKVGDMMSGISDANNDPQYQPGVILRDATESEWYDCLKNHGISKEIADLTLAHHRAYARDGIRFYEVSFD